MKIKALALVVPALLMAGAANAAEVYNKDGNKLDLYGKVDGLHYFSDDSGSNGDQSYVRLGFKGETQINDQLIGYGQWEYNIQADTPESDSGNSWTRLGFAGLKFGDLGSFDYGRNYGALYDIEAWTDMLPEFGGDSYTQTDVYFTGRANGIASYRNNDFFGLVDGLNFALQYQGKNEDGGAGEGTANGAGGDMEKGNGDGFAMSTTYDLNDLLPGLSVGAAYSSSDRTNEQVLAGGVNNRLHKSAGGDTAEAWTIGTKYDANDVYLAMMYAETNNMTRYGNGNNIANKTQNFEAVAQYQFDFGLRPSLAWVYSQGKDMGGYQGRHNIEYTDKALVNYIDVGATYYFNKNMSTYVDYKINMLDNDVQFYQDNGIATDDILAVGLVYQF
ncbi:TPA: porin OmpC [Kluyvera ascorbata]|nr:porin OmpC [Kluyvera ascorbata]HED1310421.1 porin OmpC [Kluyvera ascorbata]